MGIPGWLADFLGISDLVNSFVAPFNLCVHVAESILITPADQYSTTAWSFITGDLLPWFQFLGVFLMNIFFLIGIARMSSNLKENITTEVVVEQIIKIVIANALIVHIQDIVAIFLSLSTDVTNMWTLPNIELQFATEYDLGTLFGILALFLVAMIMSIVCGGIILLEVLGRYLNLYLLIVSAPIALSTWAGGRDLEQTAYAWIKSFLSAIFQVVIIGLALNLGMKMTHSLAGVFNNTGIVGLFDGFGDMIFNLIAMGFITMAVKGSREFLQRAFNLR